MNNVIPFKIKNKGSLVRATMARLKEELELTRGGVMSQWALRDMAEDYLKDYVMVLNKGTGKASMVKKDRFDENGNIKWGEIVVLDLWRRRRNACTSSSTAAS